ncbi:DUF1396 domain-containing protein [Streptomyces sp. SA15]|uniref:DUF1396 domain-containing protein n=1 Tax=Streptomyces sp. SA15 TaxID=934019 RepID=UPI0015C94F17|nr:DUF1396 domain-containing protein [Streptomyces sp. SA15]
MCRRATGAGLAVLLLAAGAAACGKGEDSPKMTPVAAVAKAAKNAEDIKSFRYRLTGKVPEQGRVKAEAAMSMKPTVAMSMKMTALDQGADGTAEIRLVDKAMYIGGGAAAAKEMDGKSWLKFDLSELGAEGLDDPSLGAGQADKNPADQSTFLTGSKDVEDVGTETVDGVKTTHYKGTVTMKELQESLKGEDDATRDRRFDQFTKLGVDAVTMDMWVDGDHQTKQFRMRGDGDKGPLDMTITFLDVNEPVTVAAPPAKDTMDLAEMMDEAQS